MEKVWNYLRIILYVTDIAIEINNISSNTAIDPNNKSEISSNEHTKCNIKACIANMSFIFSITVILSTFPILNEKPCLLNLRLYLSIILIVFLFVL